MSIDLLDPTWQDQFAVVLGTWTFVHDRVVSREVPASYYTLNQQWLEVTSNLNDAQFSTQWVVDSFDARHRTRDLLVVPGGHALDIFTVSYQTHSTNRVDVFGRSVSKR